MPNRRGDPATLGDIAGLPHVPLGADALDILELVLTGALPSLPPLAGVSFDREVVLTDGENAPLALVVPGPPAEVRPVRGFARGAGPVWDQAIRRSADDVVSDMGAVTARGGRVLGVVIDDVPTRADLDALVARVAAIAPEAVRCAAPIGRAARGDAQAAVDGAGLVRVAFAVADAISAAQAGLRVETVVIPFPRDRVADAAGTRLTDVLAGYGARESMTVRDVRSPDDAARVSALPGTLDREISALYPDAIAAEVHRARRRGGVQGAGAVVLFTGLSGAGKSTIARALADDLDADSDRIVTLLDGDEVRRYLSSDLGFDAASRDRNIERVAYVSALIAEHRGIAIAAPIAPYAQARQAARELVEPHGTFLLVFVDTPLAVCEQRDRKGLYARARAGEIADFTGVSAPFEVPQDADVRIDTTTTEVAEAVRLIRRVLDERLAD
jgi:sulfate adenylyltransferase